jgi:hypothetical protein
VGDAQAGIAMRGRGQLFAAVGVVALVVAAALVLQRGVGPRALASAGPGAAPSGAWFCPHGGGGGWTATLELANPGPRPVDVRVTALSGRRPAAPRSLAVEPGTTLGVPVDAGARESATLVEYFGGWIAAGWVAHAGGGEKGVAAEACAPSAGTTWLLPDGSTKLAEEATSSQNQKTLDPYVVVMNPFAVDAVFSVSLYTDDRSPVRPGDWTNVVLEPFRSRAFLLNDQLLGHATVAAEIEAKVGRVVASSLDVDELGGIRSSLGQRPPTPGSAVLPGAFDQGRTELVAMNPTSAAVQPSGIVLGRDDQAPLGDADARINPDAAQTFATTTDGPSALVVRVPSATAVVRRTFGRTADQAATPPGAPAAAWVLLPAVAGEPSHPGVVIANPAANPADVSLTSLPTGDGGSPASGIVAVPGLRTVAAPADLVASQPAAAILAMSTDGTFVPASASYSLGQEGYAGYAVALGVPIPAAWVPPAA